jgi:dienelactone hydrolase
MKSLANIKRLYLSPSENHQHVASRLVPSMKYKDGNVLKWQKTLRSKLRELVGDEPPRAPLNPRRLWIREYPLGTIEKIVYTSEPYCDVVAYVCLPKNVKPSYTFFICLQGHTSGMHNSISVDREDEGKMIRVPKHRDFGLWCLRNGLAAFCIEQRSFGERRELKQGKISKQGCHDASMHALMLGRTMIGERVFDVDRGIDYLATRDDVDMKRIGIMGNSGGGTISVFSAALLPRISFAMPSCYFCTFRQSIMSIWHCVDNYVPGLLKYAEMPDVMGLFAPKPVVFVAGKEDPLFPIEATRRAFRDLKRIYKAVGAENHCHLVEGRGGHRFYADISWPRMLEMIN